MLASFTVMEKNVCKVWRSYFQYFFQISRLKWKLWIFDYFFHEYNQLETLRRYRHFICQEPLSLLRDCSPQRGQRGNFVSFFSVNKSLLHIFWWIIVNGSSLALWFFYFSLLFLFLTYLCLFSNFMLISATSKKRKPFKGKCTS